MINRRAFGWSLPFQVDPTLLLETLALAVIAALLAGLYPIWRMTRARPADALRTE
ncbi:MAG: FtsX-like permease family protein [Candidatus Contendobacter sp.]|nr:FtsX-like permease family protein [Candidatus Contendobacter sp.]